MISSESVHQVETVFLFLLLFIAVFAVIAQKLKIAYPIVLIVAGLLVSVIPHVPRTPLNPDLVFLVLLPPLLFASASVASWRELRSNSVNIGLLAFGLVGFTVWGVAEFCDRFIVALDWKAGFVLGAVVAATDAIAATSIARSIGLPGRIVDILEGESLLNDATSLLALEFGLRLLNRGDSPGMGEALLRFLWLTVAGAGIGIAVGWIFAKGHALIEDGPVEIVLSLVTPYAAYLAGEWAAASGVIAVVACGLYIGRKSATIYSPRVRMQVRGVWEAIEFILNGLVFVLIGLQLPIILSLIRGEYGGLTLIRYGLVFSAVLIVLRLIWTFTSSWVSEVVRTRMLRRKGPPLRWKRVFVVGWTGMRGVIALAASISLPETIANGKPFTQRSLIIFLAFSVILITLVLQGLTLPPLIRALGLAKPKEVDAEELQARRIMLRSAIEHLEQGRQSAAPEMRHVYDDLLHRYQHRIAALGGGQDAHADADALDPGTYARLQEVATGAIQAERRTVIGLRDEERIGDDALRAMELELDLQEFRYQL